MANTIWPFIPFVALRGAQIFFAIVLLGLSGYVGSQFDPAWSPWFTLTTSIFTLIGAGFLLVTFFIAPAFTAPLITLGVDAFLFLFWLISLAGFADQASPILSTNVSCRGSNLCGSVKGTMALIVFEFLLFLGTLVFSALWFHRERSGKTKGINPEGGFTSTGGVHNTHGTYPMQQQQVMPNPPPAQQPAAYSQEQQFQFQPQHEQFQPQHEQFKPQHEQFQPQYQPLEQQGTAPAPAAHTGYPHAQ